MAGELEPGWRRHRHRQDTVLHLYSHRPLRCRHSAGDEFQGADHGTHPYLLESRLKRRHAKHIAGDDVQGRRAPCVVEVQVGLVLHGPGLHRNRRAEVEHSQPAAVSSGSDERECVVRSSHLEETFQQVLRETDAARHPAR